MNSDFKELLSLFNAKTVRYLIVGGVALFFTRNLVTRKTLTSGSL